jgi:uncharacterized membrane protein YbhN (UPF0104 family)
MTVSVPVHDSTAQGETAQPGRRRGLDRAFRLVVAGVLVVAAVRFLRLGDLARAVELVRHAGWPIVAVLVPTGLTMGLDARGWQLVLRTIGRRVRWTTLYPVRLAAESLVLSIPGGSFAAEAAKLGLLRSAAGVPLGLGAASLALSKACHIGGEALYLTVAALVVVATGAARGAHGLLSPPLLATLGAVAVAATSATIFLLLRDVNGVFAFFRRTLSRSERVRRWADARRAGFVELDRSAQGFFSAPLATRLACFAHFAVEWFIEGLETWLILRCLGAPVGFAAAIVVDGLGSLLRAMAFFVPAGLGVQDAAQVAVLGMLGVPDAAITGAALIFVKRTKEVFWLFTGLAIGAGKRVTWLKPELERREPAPASAPSVGGARSLGLAIAQEPVVPEGGAPALPVRNTILTESEGTPP